ncbi:hypothetical protein AWC38_SpisGene22516 [Stylophora pistillata]|uniref:Uncharacterized protein n=1 Tax=Stylophora pistillata TaxID=50429 RepID=A0A2B4RB06_STYPI|nr:hypothetical protein AWC38_SpisGene22516 [Stylophora pistillata]
MNGSFLLEAFGRIAISFTSGVTEHYSAGEPEVEIFGYDNTFSREGREWNCHPVDKPIYQEYSLPSDNEYDLLSVGNFRVKYRLIDASSPDESKDEQQDGNDDMAWKRFRPSALRTVCQSMYIGALISLLTPAIIGLLNIMISYLSYETTRNCEFQPKKTIPVKIQWIRTLSDVVGVAFLYMWFFVGMLFLFRPYQLKGVKRKLTLVAFVLFCVDTLYRVFLQVFRLSHSQLSVSQKIPLNVLFRLKRIAHPGYSFILLLPLYFGSAVMFRVMQAGLDNLKFIAVLGILHGAVEVLERSTMVFIDHICHVIWKRQSSSWGSFRTPRRERLMADITIISMLGESTAIVSVNGFLYLYQFIYLQNIPLLKVLQEFVIHTSVALVIEWFFTSLSLAIATRFQNIAVMAVWRKMWKRHILAAMANMVPVAIWTTANLLKVVHGFFDEFKSHPCKMPFT